MNGNPAGASISVTPEKPEHPAEGTQKAGKDSEFDRFEVLTSKLTHVSKAEIDEKRREQEGD
jgi:hypothetical protein